MSKAKRNLPQSHAPVITIERSEFQHLTRTLATIGRKAANAQRILEAIDVRASSEFAESMKIIRGLPAEKGGDQ